MGKLRVFFTIALVAALLPLNAFARYEEGDIVQDPKHPNIKREMIEEVSQKWLVHITGKLPVTATLNGHDYVDLGIKVDGKLIMWAACDVGATKPEQAGTTYGWGEVEHKAKLGGGGSVSYGQKVYRSTILGNPKYDAARKHWGGKWRMPTVPELYMLIRKCTWEQAEMNGQRGFLLTSLKNGNMLFLPSLGSDDIYCDYWSTDECDMEGKLQACKLNAEGASSWRDRVVIGRSLRTDQLPIRAVFIP